MLMLHVYTRSVYAGVYYLLSMYGIRSISSVGTVLVIYMV